MRFTPIVAWAVLAYGSLADDAQKVLSDESSASAAESATASVDTSLPTFTVSLFPQPPSSRQQREHCQYRACARSSPHIPLLELRELQEHVQTAQIGRSASNVLAISSPQTSRLHSLSSSPMTGRHDGSLPTPRRTSRAQARRRRNGRTSASGLLRSPPSTREWRETRAWLSRTRPLTTPSPPSSPRRLTTRAKLWLFNTRPSSRVRNPASLTLTARSSFTDPTRSSRPRVRWCLHEAAPREQGSPPG